MVTRDGPDEAKKRKDPPGQRKWAFLAVVVLTSSVAASDTRIQDACRSRLCVESLPNRRPGCFGLAGESQLRPAAPPKETCDGNAISPKSSHSGDPRQARASIRLGNTSRWCHPGSPFPGVRKVNNSFSAWLAPTGRGGTTRFTRIMASASQ